MNKYTESLDKIEHIFLIKAGSLLEIEEFIVNKIS